MPKMNTEFWQDRRVLVTGARGFLASHLTEALTEAGAEVVGLVRDEPPGTYFEQQRLTERTTLVRGDLLDLALLERVLAQYEIHTAFHLAAQSLVGTAMRAPLTTFETNIRGTYFLLEACRQAWQAGTLEGLVVASSDKAYGAHRDLPYTEEFALQGSYPYDVSKSCADLLARAYHTSFELPVAVTRCANLYGPGDLNFSRLIPGVMRWVLHDERPIIRSDGTPQRDYLFVEDAVRGYLVLGENLTQPEVVGRAFNFGTGEPVAVLDLVQEIIAVAGKEELTPDVRGHSPGEIPHQYLSAEQARRVLGWQALVPRAEGLRRTYEWYAEQCAR